MSIIPGYPGLVFNDPSVFVVAGNVSFSTTNLPATSGANWDLFSFTVPIFNNLIFTFYAGGGGGASSGDISHCQPGHTAGNSVLTFANGSSISALGGQGGGAPFLSGDQQSGFFTNNGNPGAGGSTANVGTINAANTILAVGQAGYGDSLNTQLGGAHPLVYGGGSGRSFTQGQIGGSGGGPGAIYLQFGFGQIAVNAVVQIAVGRGGIAGTNFNPGSNGQNGIVTVAWS